MVKYICKAFSPRTQQIATAITVIANYNNELEKCRKNPKNNPNVW